MMITIIVRRQPAANTDIMIYHRLHITFRLTSCRQTSLELTMKACSLNDQTCTPCLAFGTGTSLTAKDATYLCSLAIKRGFRHLDTAQMYGNKDSVGRSIAASGLSRSELYITTKLGNLPDRDGSLKIHYAGLYGDCRSTM